MGNFRIGKEAQSFSGEEESQTDNSFTPFKSGTTIYVKVLGEHDRMSYFGYGLFKPRVNTFVAKNPSKKSKNGYPVENLTPWDKAWKYHADKSEKFRDHHSQEAYKYMPKLRGAFGFYDLTSGEQIVVDFTAKQSEVIQGIIDRNATRLDRLAFELTKEGQRENTVVSLTPVMFPEEDLTEEQQENFKNAPEEFDLTNFEGLVYEMDEDEQIEKLVEAGFDVTLIGLEPPKKEDDQQQGPGSGPDGEITDDDLPF